MTILSRCPRCKKIVAPPHDCSGICPKVRKIGFFAGNRCCLPKGHDGQHRAAAGFTWDA